ncbi:head-tail adaptor protein [Marinobacter nauticus]|uniref:head-tail adaptor protein n=1 Tax=Marinobacter nauticus TaxID=2743 RepID=UPI001C974125|nr:head-tail adaptor protein [Marinobacter nauticus]MBY6102302.1 head-tail adaptor protein [Marinobacter nauticus]
MRSGHLRTRLSILEGGAEVGKVWADVRPPTESGEAKGLRESGSTKVIIRPRPDIRPGQILTGKGYVLVVEAAGDHLARGRDLHITCTRLLGTPGTYTQKDGTEINVLAHVAVNTPYIGLNGQLMDFRYRVEVPSHQAPESWQPGDKITVGGREYVLTGLAEDSGHGQVTAYTA